MFQKQSAPIGSQAGTLSISVNALQPRINVIHYTMTEFEEFEIDPASLLAGDTSLSKFSSAVTDPHSVTWVDIQGLGDANVLERVASIFGLHSLTISDVVNTPQRAKTEEYPDYLVYIGHTVSIKGDTIDKQSASATVKGFSAIDGQLIHAELAIEQLSVVVSRSFVLTFQESYGDQLDPVRVRIRNNKGIIRKHGNDFLAYSIIDTSIDAYYPVLETLGEIMEVLEEYVISDPTRNTLRNIYTIKRELLLLRRSIWPEREAITSLMREDSSVIERPTRIYFRDTYEHIVQVMDVLESFRELTNGFLDVYMSSASNRLNEIMKVLTIIGTIFMPLSFVAGVYGMNFSHMPELGWRWSYPIFWIASVTMTCIMLYYFNRSGWLRSKQTRHD